MIAQITGELVEINSNSLILICQGIGYQLQVTQITSSQLDLAKSVTLYTELIVREDSLTLYGFLNKSEKTLFNLVQQVSGIGPRLALEICNTYTLTKFSEVIKLKDGKQLQLVPGIGKKVAERLILELKDEISKYGIAPASTPEFIANEDSNSVDKFEKNKILENALENLGFNKYLANKTIKNTLSEYPDLTMSELLRLTLQRLDKPRN